MKKYSLILAAGLVLSPALCTLSAAVPAGFEEEVSAVTHDIACGSRNGELEVWGVATDRTGLERYNQYSLGNNPWMRREAKDGQGNMLTLESVSVASDGTMVVLDAHGKAYEYNFEQRYFVPLFAGKGNEALDLDVIAVGNQGSIWAVDVDNKTLYQHTDAEGWIVREKGIAVDVAVGVDGTVVALNDGHKPYMMIAAGKWDKIGDAPMATIAVGSKEHIWGVTKDGKLTQYSNDAWVEVKGTGDKPAAACKDVAVNAAGTVFVIAADDDVYHKGEDGFVVVKPAMKALNAEVAKNPELHDETASSATASVDAKDAAKHGKKAAKKGAKKVTASAEGIQVAPVKKTRMQAKKEGKIVAPTAAAKEKGKKTKRKASASKQSAVAKKSGEKIAPKRGKKGAKAAKEAHAKIAKKGSKNAKKNAGKKDRKIMSVSKKQGASSVDKKGAVKPVKGGKPSAKKAAKKAAKHG